MRLAVAGGVPGVTTAGHVPPQLQPLITEPVELDIHHLRGVVLSAAVTHPLHADGVVYRAFGNKVFISFCPRPEVGEINYLKEKTVCTEIILFHCWPEVKGENNLKK